MSAIEPKFKPASEKEKVAIKAIKDAFANLPRGLFVTVDGGDGEVSVWRAYPGCKASGFGIGSFRTSRIK